MTRLPRPQPLLWLALAAALAMGLQEWLALSRSRLRDRRDRWAHGLHAGRRA